MLNTIYNTFQRIFSRRLPYPTSSPSYSTPSRGSVLLSYLSDVLLWPDDKVNFLGHSAFWECKEIVNIFNRMGYDVDVINWSDNSFLPAKKYDVIIDIDSNLQRLAPFLSNETVRILHLTGSYGPFQHKAELARVAAFEQRTGCLYSPKRLVRWLELAERSLALAGHCSLLGNEFVLSTYPQKYRDKISLIPVSGSVLSRVRNEIDMMSAGREFLWFFGSGAVHKGLDLVIDYFVKHPDLVLNIAGKFESEADFMLAYAEKLKSKNIHVLGYLTPGKPSFGEILKNVSYFIAPSCSEGASPSVVTCLQFGLYPIISHQTGINLPNGCGLCLDELSCDAIHRAVSKVLSLDHTEVVRQTFRCQQMALESYSRQAFSKSYAAFSGRVLGVS